MTVPRFSIQQSLSRPVPTRRAVQRIFTFAEGWGMKLYAWAVLVGGLGGGLLTAGVDGVRGQAAPAPLVKLKQNYPNPFNPATTIPFILSGDLLPTVTGRRFRSPFTTCSRKSSRFRFFREPARS